MKRGGSMLSKISKRKILIVDDEPDVRELIKRILSKDNLVIEASNGEEAVYIAKSKRPDIIFMDMMMPRMDGLNACHAIKTGEGTRNIPVIILTAVDMEGNRQLAKEIWGADEYITKPFGPRTLFEAIDRFL
jgi:two-component system, OmpR family, alkaline phosphatase synthesis response regulator PhoP